MSDDVDNEHLKLNEQQRAERRALIWLVWQLNHRPDCGLPIISHTAISYINSIVEQGTAKWGEGVQRRFDTPYLES